MPEDFYNEVLVMAAKQLKSHKIIQSHKSESRQQDVDKNWNEVLVAIATAIAKEGSFVHNLLGISSRHQRWKRNCRR